MKKMKHSHVKNHISEILDTSPAWRLGTDVYIPFINSIQMFTNSEKIQPVCLDTGSLSSYFTNIMRQFVQFELDRITRFSKILIKTLWIVFPPYYEKYNKCFPVILDWIRGKCKNVFFDNVKHGNRRFNVIWNSCKS